MSATFLDKFDDEELKEKAGTDKFEDAFVKIVKGEIK